jgi:hypothetical protein
VLENGESRYPLRLDTSELTVGYVDVISIPLTMRGCLHKYDDPETQEQQRGE